MDYHDSSAGTARLAVIKYAATVPEKIFFNPGDALRPPPVASDQYPIHRWTRRFRNSIHQLSGSGVRQRFPGYL